MEGSRLFDMIPDYGNGSLPGMSFEKVETHCGLLEAHLANQAVDPIELEGVWASTPEEILWRVLMRLPVATQCRFRCVCSSWRNALSNPSSIERQLFDHTESRPSGTICFDGSSRSRPKFFCHGVRKWFSIPFKPESSLDLIWTLMAADGGLFCYGGAVRSSIWLLVCNPITCSYHVIPPPDHEDPESGFRHPKMLHFAVDLKAETVTFKVLLLRELDIWLFDSKPRDWKAIPSCWEAFQFGAGTAYEMRRRFSWKNVIYTWTGGPCSFLAIDTESGLSCKVELDLPCNTKKKFQIRSSRDQVMLVQLNPTPGEPLCIWKLLENSVDSLSLMGAQWERVPIELPISLRPIIDQFQAFHCHGSEYICFLTGWTDHWIKYTLQTRTWCVLPRRWGPELKPVNPETQNHAERYLWFDWEPRIDVDLETRIFKESDYPLLGFCRNHDEFFGDFFDATDYIYDLS